MNSSTTSSFRKLFGQLPPPIQALARKNFRLWLTNPRHSSLHFKKVGEYWSARIGSSYRVLGRMQGDTLYWFWIGSHDEYDRILGE